MNNVSIVNTTPRAKANLAVLVRFETRRSHGRMRTVGSGGVWRKSKPVISENLLDDFHYCKEWVEQNNVLARDPYGKILFLLTGENVQKHLFKAVAILKANGVDMRMVWLVDDLFSPANFKLIAEYGDYDFIRTIVQIAVDWVRVPTKTLANLEEVVRKSIFF